MSLFASLHKKIDINFILLILTLGVFLTFCRGIIVSPYDTNLFQEGVMLMRHYNDLGMIHPLFSSNNYDFPSYYLFPFSWYYSHTFHIIAAIAYQAIILFIVSILLRMSGFAAFPSALMATLTISVGPLVLHKLINMSVLNPSPQQIITYFDPRYFTIPFAGLAILTLLNKRFILAGICVGLSTFMHVKFGFRFFYLVFFSMILWNLYGAKLAGSADHINGKNLFKFFLAWLIAFIITMIQIKNGMNLFTEMNLPRTDDYLFGPLSWLIKSEPDDWLISNHLLTGLGILKLLIPSGLAFVFCEVIRRIGTEKHRILAVVCMQGVVIALLVAAFSFLLEMVLIDILPEKITTILMLTRMWDQFWVIATAFTLGGSICFLFFLQHFLGSEGRGAQIFLISGLIVLVLSNGVSILLLRPTKWVPIITETSLDDVSSVFEYYQVCNQSTELYNTTYLEAVAATKQNNNVLFQSRLNTMETLFQSTVAGKGINVQKNPDVYNLDVLNGLANGQISTSIKKLFQRSDRHSEDVFVWDCWDAPANSVQKRKFTLPTDDVFTAYTWIRDHLPKDRGIIQPPYLGEGALAGFAKHVHFWDSKVDQHSMYMLASYYTAGMRRLRLVTGPYAPERYFGVIFGEVGPMGRLFFLKMQTKDFLAIRAEYPNYDYVLTENQTLEGMRKIYSNQTLALYALDKK